MGKIVLENDNKSVPITVYCKAKNKPRLFELLNRVVHLYEAYNKREDFFLSL
jgi:hypothetical protein